MESKRQTSVWLPVDVLAQLKIMAVRHQVSASRIVEELIRTANRQ